MISGLIRRDLRARYAGSALGIVWTLLYPLLLLLVYLFVFSAILQVKFTTEGGSGAFALYLLAGLLPWLGFQEGITKAATSIVDNTGLVKAMRFPAVVLVAGSVLASSVTFLLSLGVLLGALLVTGRLPWVTLPFLPVLVFLQVTLAFGLGLIAASFQTLLRDTLPVLQMVFMVWFYLTPILYPLSYVPARFASLFTWNPFTPLITAYRAVLLEGKVPSMLDIWPSCVWMVVFLFLGHLVFSRVEPGFADVL